MYFNEEHKHMVENRGYIYIGSYDRKEVTLDGKNKKMNKIHIRVECSYCGKKYDIDIYSFRNGVNCTNCCGSYEKSFAHHIEVELGEDINKYWNWEKNDKLGINPYYITKGNNRKKIWLYCQNKDYHNNEGGYQNTPVQFVNGGRCPYCNPFASHKVHKLDSFAQWGIDTFGDDFLEKYWSDKNDELGINPWKIAPQSNEKNIYILCQEHDYHNDFGGYLTSPEKFYMGRRCPYCTNNQGKIHPKDSFAGVYPEKAKYWSENNDKTSFEVSPHARGKYKFICQECGEEFERSLDSLNHSNCGVYCQDCNNSQLEQETKRILQKYNIEYISQIKYNGLLGLGGGNLSYDFYLPQYNTLIECQGEQHEKWIEGWITKEGFERQLEHDKRKKNYAENHSINFLEIWYYDIDNIEQILIKQLNLI